MATSQQQADFVSTYAPYAQQAGNTLGVSPTTILGQWAHESNWGTSNLAINNNNLGGIAQPGGGYASYASPQAFTDSYISTLQNPRYASALNTGSDVGAFTTGLAAGGYYTDNPLSYGSDVLSNTNLINTMAPNLNTGSMAQGYGPSIDVGSQPYDPSLPLGVPGSQFTPYGGTTMSGFNFNLPGTGGLSTVTGQTENINLTPQTATTIGGWLGGILQDVENLASRGFLIFIAALLLLVALWHVLEPGSSPIRRVA